MPVPCSASMLTGWLMDYQARKLNKDDAMDRCKWRKMIKDVR